MKKWNCKWNEIYRDPTRHDELVQYEDPDNNYFAAFLKEANFKNKKVLDIGAGTGRLTLLFAPIVKEIHALDIEESQVAFLKRKVKNQEIENVIPVVGSAEKLSFKNNSFDIVISSFTIGGRDQKKAIQEILRVLKPGGKCIITDAHSGEFIELWENHSDPGIKAIVLKQYHDLLKLHTFKTKLIKSNWRFPTVSKAVEQLGYVLGGHVGSYLEENKKKEISMKAFMLTGTKK
tara:strand:+ start:609 stop:1307 length:699 start_codon:yes stop_codon:yes gene_type:complete